MSSESSESSPCSKFIATIQGKCAKNALQQSWDDSVDRKSCKHVPSVCRAGIETRIGVDTICGLFRRVVDMIGLIYD